MDNLHWRGRVSDASSSGVESSGLASADNSPDVIPASPDSVERSFSSTPKSHRNVLMKHRDHLHERGIFKRAEIGKVYVPESDDDDDSDVVDSGSENKIISESEGEIISDSCASSGEESLPDINALSTGSDIHSPAVMPRASYLVGSPASGKMLEHNLNVSDLKKSGRVLSSTPTHDTSSWRKSSVGNTLSDDDDDINSPVFKSKQARAKNVIDSDSSSDESENPVPQYSKSRKSHSATNYGNYFEGRHDSSYSEGRHDSSYSEGRHDSSNASKDSNSLDSADYYNIKSKQTKSRSYQHSPEVVSNSLSVRGKYSSAEKNEGCRSKQDIIDSSVSSESVSPAPQSLRKKIVNIIDSDIENSSILSAESPVSALTSPRERSNINDNSYISVSSPEEKKALTPQEKYGHKFKIKKKTQRDSDKLDDSLDSSKNRAEIEEASFISSSPENKKALTPQEKYGHKFKIKKKTPEKPKDLDEANSLPMHANSSFNQSSSILEVSESNQSLQSSFLVSELTSSEMKMKLKEKKKLLRTANMSALPDGGSKLINQVKELEDALSNLSVNSIEDYSVDAASPVLSKDISITTSESFVESPLEKNISSSSIAIVESPETSVSPGLQELERKLQKKKKKYGQADLQSLHDGGSKLRKKISQLEQEIARRKGSLSEMYRFNSDAKEHLKPEVQNTPEVIEVVSELESKKIKLEELKMLYRAANQRSLPDGGQRLKQRITELEKEVMMLQLKASIEIKTTPANVIKVEGPQTHYKQSKMTDYNHLNQLMSKPKQETQQKPPAFELNALYDIAMDYAARNYGGKISSAREREMIRVTGEAVEDLHEALKNAPDTDVVQEEDPEGLLISLMTHQRHALAWLLWRESQLPRGGILADDMGLGKTLTMISLLLKHRDLVRNGTITEDFTSLHDSSQESEEEEKSDDDGWIQKKNYKGIPKRKGLVPSKGTLVVCPASLLGQWEGEVKKRVTKGKLKCLVYHGTSRDLDINAVAHYDMVITTYQLVMREAFPSGKEPIKKGKDDVPKMKSKHQGRLFQVGWARIILDEAHQIRNHKSKTSQACCLLRGGRRWVLTGTPVQNKEMDLYSLIRFLRVKPFEDYTCWKLQVSNNSAQGMRRLSLIIKAVMLRRTKDQVDQNTGKKLIELPEKKVVQHTLCLTQKEREVYDRIFTFSRSTLTHYMKSQEEREQEKMEKWGGKASRPVVQKKPDDYKYTPTLACDEAYIGNVKAHHLLILLLRLRQICCHPSLIKGMIDTETKEVDGIEATEQEGLELDIVSQMADMSLRATSDIEEEADEKVKNNILTMSNPIFQLQAPSSKIDRIIGELQNIRGLGTKEKSVVVSQWTSMLDVVHQHLQDVGIRCHTISGQVLVKDRAAIVEDFNTNAKGPKVMLLSLGAGGVGLNLIGANHLFLIDMHWNPQLEAQACDRIYRVGQIRPVTIHRFVVENTVEERILELQQKKLQLADEVLSGAKRTTNNKLTLEDMKSLFNVGGNSALNTKQ